MALVSHRTAEDVLKLELTEGVAWDAGGNIFLEPHNMLPTQYLNAFDGPGQPVHWDLRSGMRKRIRGHQILISRPGASTGERRASMAQQTTAPILPSEPGFLWEGPWHPGPRRYAEGAADPPPLVTQVALSLVGFKAGTYAYSYGLADEYGNSTTTSAFRPFTIANNVIPLLPLPDYLGASYSQGAKYLEIYLTRLGGVLTTAVRIRRVELAKIAGETTYRLRGPWKPGPKPPRDNEAGVGIPKAPDDEDFRMVPDQRDLRAGRWTPHYQLKNERGPGVYGRPGKAITVKGDMVRPAEPVSSAPVMEAPAMEAQGWVSPGGGTNVKRNKIENSFFESFFGNGYGGPREDGANFPEDDDDGGDTGTDPAAQPYQGIKKRKRALKIRRPREAKEKQLDWTVAFRYEAPTPDDNAPEGEGSYAAGGQTWYRAYPRNNRQGTERWFGPDVEYIIVNGYPPEEEPAGLRVGLVQADPPIDDASLLQAPDPTSAPEAPEMDGRETAPSGPYQAATQPEYEDGTHGPIGSPASAPMADGFTNLITPATTANLVRNPDGAAIDNAGLPLAWTTQFVEGVHSAKFGHAPGSFGLYTTANVADAATPRAVSERCWLRTAEVLTLAFDLAVDFRSAGRAAVKVRPVNEEGVAIGADITVDTLAALGQKGPIVTYLAAPQAEIPSGLESTPLSLPEGTAAVQVVVTMDKGADTTTNLGMRVIGLRLFPYPADARRVVFATLPTQADDFGPDASAPVPPHSYSAVGYPKQPLGVTPPAQQAPIQVVDFPSASWPSGWTENTNQAGQAIEFIPAAAAALGPTTQRAWRIQSLGEAPGTRVTRSYTPGTADNALAMRFLLYVEDMPGAGDIRMFAIADAAGTSIALLSLRNSGVLFCRIVNKNGSFNREYVVAGGITAGTLIDAEIHVTGGNSKAGAVSVSIGLNGQTRSARPAVTGLDFTDRQPITAQAGVLSETNPRAKWVFRVRGIVLTRRGDVLDRESPPVVVGYTPPPVDRPTRTVSSVTTARELDPDGNDVGQAYLLVQPGDGPVSVPLLEDPVALKPGEEYTTACFGRWRVFEGTSEGIKVMAYAPDREPLEVGRIHSGASAMTGTRGWLQTDDFAVFTMPEEYRTVNLVAALQPGEYVFQEFLLTRGDYGGTAEADFALRDARRGFGRADEGEVAALLPAAGPPSFGAVGPNAATYVSGFGAQGAEDVMPAGVDLSAHYASGYDPSAFDFETPHRALVLRDAPYFRIRCVLSGDGRNTPIIPPGGMHLRTWCPLPVLLREDGSHFEGVAFVSPNVWEDAWPDVEAGNVGGRHQSRRKTGPIRRLRDITIVALTEYAAQEIAALSMTAPLIVELPHAGGTVPGIAYTVRMREQAVFKPKEAPSFVFGGERRIATVAEIAEAWILESADLRGPLDFDRPVRF